MGLLIAIATIVLGSLAIGIVGGIQAAKSQQLLLSAAGTVGAYYLLVGIPWAWFLMEADNRSLPAFIEIFATISKSLMLLGLIPLLVTFAIAFAAAR